MGIFLAGKTTRKTTHTRKLTELEKNIQFLEKKEFLYPYEKLKLDTLKERQILLHGPSISLTRDEIIESKSDDNERDNINSVENNPADTSPEKVKQSFPSAFILYKRAKVAEVKIQNPDYRVEKDFCVGSWSNMSDIEKKPYRDLAAAEKLKLGDRFRKNIKSKSKSLAEKKEAKKLSNMKRRDMLKEEEKDSKEKEQICKKKYAEVLQTRQKKLISLKAKGESLTTSVSVIKVEISVIQNLIEDKDTQNSSTKQKYLSLFKTHRNCEKKPKNT